MVIKQEYRQRKRTKHKDGVIKKIFLECNSADSDMRSCIFLFILLRFEFPFIFLCRLLFRGERKALKIPNCFLSLVSYCVHNRVLQNDL